MLHRRLAALFRSTDGQIVPVVRELLASDECRTAQPMLKRPMEYMTGSLRALGADSDGGMGIQDQLKAMGQAPFGWPMPNGYPVHASAWITGLIPRWRFAAALVGGEIPGTSVNWSALERGASVRKLSFAGACAEMLFGAPDSSPAQRTIAAMARYGAGNLSLSCAIGLMSPDFQYH